MAPSNVLTNRRQAADLARTHAVKGLGAPRAVGQAGDQQLAVLERLTQEIAQLETSVSRAGDSPASSSAGCAALDALLPRGGYAAGCVVEYLRRTPACGASTLAWAAAAAAVQAKDGYLVVVDTQHNIYPPPLTSHGIDLAKVIFVRPQSQADALWAVDQALRTSAVAAVVAELERIDDRSARRLQLAAESGQSLALLLRGWQARQQPSWAEVQWLVRSQLESGQLESGQLESGQQERGQQERGQQERGQQERGQQERGQQERGQQERGQLGRRWHVQLARARGGQAGRSALLELEPMTGRLRLASHPISVLRPSQSNSHERLNTAAASAQPSQGALHLASQLAHTASRPAAGSQQPNSSQHSSSQHSSSQPSRRAAAG